MTSIPITIPVRDDAIEFPEIDRAALFYDALEEVGVSVANKDVVDLGAGMGSIAIGSVRRGAHTVRAYDIDRSRLDELSLRARSAGLNIDVTQRDLLDGAMTQNFADIAFMIGVAEYAGLWRAEQSVESLQIQVLRTAHEMLRPGGMLVLGTKNRMWPKLLLSDVHTHQPIVALLPRSLADKLNRRLVGESYRHHIHSVSGWSRLLENAGFSQIRPLVPYFSYQFPLSIVGSPRRSDSDRIEEMLATHPELRQFAGDAWKIKLHLSALAGWFGLTVSQSLILLAVK